MKKILVILLVLISTIGFSQKPTDIMISIPNNELKTKTANYEYLSKLIFKEINEYRKSKNLNVLIWDTILFNDCKKWTDYLTINNEFRHPDIITDTLYSSRFKIECITLVYNNNDTYITNSKTAISHWKNSRPHNSGLLTSDAVMGAVSVSSTNKSHLIISFRIKLTDY